MPKTKNKKYIPFVTNERLKKIKYHILPSSGLYRFIETINIVGFQKLPAGFSRSGKGFTAPASYLVSVLSRSFNKKIEIIVVDRGKAFIKTLERKVKVYFGYDELMNLLNQLKQYRKERNEKSRDIVAKFLHYEFPGRFKKISGKYDPGYKKDQFYEILRKKNIFKNLSRADIDGLAEFYPKFLRTHSSKLSKARRFSITRQNKNTGESIYLGAVIKEFERKLESKAQDEDRWQKFLKEHILLFNTNYTDLFEKENLSRNKDYPDFMLKNIYEYLDIYEIKKPNTILLRWDTSHENYFWSSEMAKAISQVENYIHELQRNQDVLINLKNA